eukprot:scaffold13757_cov73-Phaeocystis_antarctica.AAC.2
MIGCIKAISPCVKSASEKLFLDLHTVLAPSGEERTLDTSAQVERTGRCCRRSNSDTQTRCGSGIAMVLVSSASGPRVSGCTRAPRVVPKSLNLDSQTLVFTTLYARFRLAFHIEQQQFSRETV